MNQSTKSGISTKRRAQWRWSVTFGASAGLLATTMLVPATSAWAQDDDESLIIVNTAGDRDLSNGAPEPLAGVTLHLREQDGTEIEDDWATCISEIDGLCTFTVPDTGPGGGNEDVILLVVQEEDGVPDGWFANTDLRIGGALGNSIPTEYEFLVGPLVGGEIYESGVDFMSTAPNFRTSSGDWQQSRDNPPLPIRCGLNVAMVMDLSLSIEGELQNMKNAGNSFVDALEGTPSRMAAFNFSTDSPADDDNPNFPALLPVGTPGDAQTFKDQYADWSLVSSTNWDAAMRAVGEGNQLPQDDYDLVVFITDGNPTTNGAPDAPISANNDIADVEHGIFSANTVKDQGARNVMVGVGDGIDQATWPNLISMSGPTQFDGDNLLDADFLTVDQFEEVGEALNELVAQLCENNITVTKVIENRDGTESAGQEWTYNVEVTEGNATIAPPSDTTDDTGSVAFELTYDEGEDQAQVLITELMQEGFELVPHGGQVADCEGAEVDSDFGDNPSITVTALAGETVQCEFRNRLIPAELVVDKQWLIDGESLSEGEQPMGFDAELELNEPGGDEMIPQAWGNPRSGYEVGETATGAENITLPDECTTETVTLERTDGTGGPIEIDPEEFELEIYALLNEYTVTNVVACTATLTLIKTVDNSDGGDAEPEDWVLSADGPTPIEGVTGSEEVTEATVGVGDYVLSESSDTEGYVAEPWVCVLEGSDDPINDEDLVSVERDAQVICTVNNVFVPDTGTLTLIKTVDGGKAEPADWGLSADGPTPIEGVTGSDDVTEATVEAGEYVLSETGDVTGYTADEWVCVLGDGDDTINDGSNVSVGADEHVTCTINNVFKKDPKPTPKPDKPDPGKHQVDKAKAGGLPLTGSSLAWLIGLAALATAVGLTLLALSKRRWGSA